MQTNTFRLCYGGAECRSMCPLKTVLPCPIIPPVVQINAPPDSSSAMIASASAKNLAAMEFVTVTMDQMNWVAHSHQSPLQTHSLVCFSLFFHLVWWSGSFFYSFSTIEENAACSKTLCFPVFQFFPFFK